MSGPPDSTAVEPETNTSDEGATVAMTDESGAPAGESTPGNDVDQETEQTGDDADEDTDSGGADPVPEPADDTSGSSGAEAPAPAQEAQPSLVTVSPEEANEVIDRAPEGLVVLDVRTASEFAGGYLPGAILADFYAADFEDQLAALDPAVPYVLYCRSGNRSGQAMAIMERLGFLEVYEVDGGIVAWMAASLPVEQP